MVPIVSNITDIDSYACVLAGGCVHVCVCVCVCVCEVVIFIVITAVTKLQYNT